MAETQPQAASGDAAAGKETAQRAGGSSGLGPNGPGLAGLEPADELCLLRAAMEALPEAVLFVHRATLRVGAANPAACQVLGYTLDELRGVELAQIVADAPGLVPTARREAPDPSAPGSECLVAEKAALRNRAGALVPVECRVRIVASPSGEYLVLVVGGRSDQLSAVSHQPSASRAADSSFIPHPSSLIPPFLPPHPAARGGGRLATCPTSPPQGRDAVTGLPDRRQFEGRLMVALRKARCRADYHFAVLFIDLDGFKAVNDAWGHLHGDRVLQAIGARLAGCIRPEDMVARFGGDEFTVLLDDLHSPPDAIRVAERIRLQLETPLEVEGRRSALGASIGIALSWLGYRDPEAMLQDADRAMYRAKAEGKARYFVWERGREEG